ncbi:T9SS type A sorting domain-containing protein [Candidatus Poribacteria bacterium]|nr:T9SS type A sorting domain-containing protein [Candidatus Poribacteria bacterium]
MVAFTLVDGEFKTYEFQDAQNTYFYALGNDGRAAGYYEDSEGLHHGVILEDDELRQYDFPDAVHTEIYGISDATGVLTGNWIDADGVQRGFTGDTILEFPGAIATFADFVNSDGNLFGSYIDADGLFQEYAYSSDGRYVAFELTNAENLEFFYVHGVNDALVRIARGKVFGDVVRTYLGTFTDGLRELKVPDSVSTQGYNINQDGSVVGFYETPDGRRHGFIAKPIKVVNQPVFQISGFNYTYENIDVPGVDFLALTASSDFEDYAGYTKSADSEKMVAFTLIDGEFKTYNFPDSQNTYFYALGNDGRAAGYYEDSEGLHKGVILEDGELRQYDFPGSVETEIWGISDATGNLTGNWTDASGVRRGFTGDIIVEYPGAVETYADFINALGGMFGSYVDENGKYTPYLRAPDGRYVSFTPPTQGTYEFFFVHGFTDTKISVSRGKVIGEVTRTYVGTFLGGLHELKVPGSVRTEGYNINQDASVVGHYDSPDGRRHGFIARLGTEEESDTFSNAYTVKLSKGLNMLSVPLAPWTPMTAKSLVGLAGATAIITLDAETQRFIAWTPNAPDDGFPIEGGKGYIVNVPQTRNFAFVGSRWINQTETTAAAPAIPKAQEAWAFVISGRLKGISAFDGYQVIVRNQRTNQTITSEVRGNYFAAATADLARRSVVKVGDVIELRVIGQNGNVESQTLNFKVTPENLANAVLHVTLDDIGKPAQNQLLQNYPNPFNPETWIPYQLSQDSSVSVTIYDMTGQLVRTLSLGFQSAGYYNSRARAAYWDGRNAIGEPVASGIYFYQLTTPSFQQTRRLVILK